MNQAKIQSSRKCQPVKTQKQKIIRIEKKMEVAKNGMWEGRNWKAEIQMEIKLRIT